MSTPPVLANGGPMNTGAIWGISIVCSLCVLLFLTIVIRTWLRRNQMQRHWAEAIAAAAVEDLPPPALARLQRELAKANAEGGLTKKEIDQAAPVSTYSARGEEHNCAICLDDIEAGSKIRTLPCGHIFDANCVENWVVRANRCPVCNAPLVDKKTEPVKEAYTAPLRRARRHRGSDGRFTLGNLTQTNEEDNTTNESPDDDPRPITNGSTPTTDPPTGDVVLDMDDAALETISSPGVGPNAPAAPSVIINFNDKK